MTLLQNNTFNNCIKAAMACLIAVMLILCFSAYHADLGNFAIFAAFILFYVQLPGLCVLRLLNIKTCHISTCLVTGLFTGWSLVILQYFITELIHTNILLFVLGPVLSLILIISVLRDRDSSPLRHFSFTKLSTAFAIFLVMALLYALLNNQYIYLSPEVSDYTYINPDKGYHLGLIDSLSHGWPLESPWVQGRIIHYHIFTEMMYSVPVRLFGVPADVALLSCGPFLTAYAFCLSFYGLFREFSAKAGRAGLYCIIFLLSNIFIAKGLDDSLAFFFIFRNENATGFGISCMLVFIMLFRYWYDRFKSGEKSITYLILVTALLMLLTGLKGPMGLVIIGSIWGTYIIGIIMRKVPLKTILPIIIMSIGFLVIYVFILGSKGQSNGGGTSIFAFATIVDVTFYKASLVAFLKSIGMPKIIRLGILLFVFMVFTLTAYIVPFVCGYVRELVLVFTGRKEYDFTRVLIYAACLVGFIALFILNYSGHSQVYFGYVAIFLVPLVSIWFFEDMEENKGLLMKIVRVIFAVMLLLSACTLVMHYEGMLHNADKAANNTYGYNRYEGVTNGEYLAMKWIRDNTSEDSLLATDRYYSVPLDEYSYQDRWTNRFFLYADYANRFCYLAGSGYNLPADDWVIRKEMVETNNKLYDPSNEKRGDLARQLGVDYLIVSKDFTDIDSLENKDYHLCFSNDSVDVYEIKY